MYTTCVFVATLVSFSGVILHLRLNHTVHAADAHIMIATQSLAISLVIAGIVSATSHVLTRRLTRPFEQLSLAASKVAQGAPEAVLSQEGCGEIATLTQAFSTLQERIEEQLKRVSVTESHWKGVAAQLREDIAERERIIATVAKRAENELRKLYRRVHQAQEGERRRIARELHDSTAQQLAAIMMCLDRLASELPGQSPDVIRLLSGARTLAEQSVQEIRNLSYLLHPPLLDRLGLTAALKEYVEGFENRSGLKIQLEVEEESTRLPYDIELAVFRVVQEGLVNIYRHSGSPFGLITLTRTPHAVNLAIHDRGGGIHSRAASSKGTRNGSSGLGLASMSERIQLLNGSLEVKSTSSGTSINVSIPISPTAA